MEKLNSFENIHFNQAINTISPDKFPKEFPCHWHKYIEIIAFPSSAKNKQSTVVKINQIDYYINPGDILFIWPGELHEIVQTDENSVFGIQFMPNVINEIPDFEPYINFFRTIKHINCETDKELAEKTLSYIENIIKIRKKNTDFANTKELICMYQVFMNFGSYVKNTILNTNIASKNKKIADKINIACNYIIENCTKSITLDSVAEYLSFSPCYFSRMFKQTVGCSFVDYLCQQRVKYAQSLLVDSTLSITEILFQSGFKSISTFNRVFHHYRSCSPSEYRQYYIL